MCDEDNYTPIMFRVFEEEFILNFIESLRKKNKISYAGIGRIIGCDRSQALRVLRGDYRMDIKKAIKILRYFDYELLISKIDVNVDSALPQDFEADQEALEAEVDIFNNPEYREDKN